MKRFEGKVVVITGGGSGMGKISCTLFAQEGASVCVVDINEKTAKATADEIIAAGGKAKAYAGIWAFIGKLPFAQILIPITLFIMLISFSTSADNSVSAISALCTQNSKIGDEAPSILKILWGVAIGVLAYLLMAYAAGAKGNDGVRYMVVAIGSVLSIFIILVIASTVNMFFVDKKASQEQE